MEPIKVLFLASEADPLVKVGGLGDIAGSLPPALKRLPRKKIGGEAIDIRLALPFHGAIRKKVHEAELLLEFDLMARDGPIKTQVYIVEENNVPTYLIAGEPIGDDSPVYDPDAAIDGHKYIFFSMAVIEMVKLLDWKPDILHANDWHTALSVYGLDLRKSLDSFFKDIHTVLTIHNLPFMGAGTAAAFERFNLPPSTHPLMPWWATKFPLPLGLQAADRIVAVSPTYAREILTPEYGCGLEAFLESRQNSISGIVNGIDMESWNPTKDASIAMNFNSSSLTRRKENKTALVDEFSLDSDLSIPLLILISRMDPQKGVDLAVGALYQAIDDNWQAILLGTGDPVLEKASRQLEKQYPERVRAAIRFDTKLSRRMYAGGDILLMPSRYEPCGLAQMMAMRYGCVPLARATGGLQDTIVDSEENGTGFLFQPATSTALAETLHRAIATYDDQERWTGMQRRGMAQDFSWENSAIQYAKLYRKLMHDQP